MGILDDAIREHLELKRKHGATSDDVERLEKEAFGPPARPGDPEFEDDGEPSAEDGDEAPSGPGDVQDWSEVLEENTEDHGEVEVEAPAAEAPVSEPESAEMTYPEAGQSPAEQARVEYSDLGDTVDHPALPEADDEAPAPAPPVEEEPFPHDEQEPAIEQEPAPPLSSDEEERAPEASAAEEEQSPPEAVIFDQGEEMDLDLDLDLDDEEEDAQPASEEVDFDLDAGDDRPAPAETVEQPGPESAPATDPGFAADEEEEDQLEDEDEDLLEETPDFLEDTPEGERLWFEQGEPKDFDFDD